MKRIKPGMRVQVAPHCSGLLSGKVGTVIPSNRVPRDGRGIPKIAGHYSPMGKDEVAIRTDGGELFTMFKNRLTVI